MMFFDAGSDKYAALANIVFLVLFDTISVFQPFFISEGTIKIPLANLYSKEHLCTQRHKFRQVLGVSQNTKPMKDWFAFVVFVFPVLLISRCL